ncbi:MAG: TrkH family potassium uptake protein [Dehalococcoidia bacterium]
MREVTRRLRIGRMVRHGVSRRSFRVALRRAGPRRLRPIRSALVVIWGLAGLIAIGTAALLLPFATRDGAETSFLTAFFTAASAACTTGLVVVDTADHWTLFGQVVILILFQIGGLGFLTSSTLILLLLRQRLDLRDRLLLQGALGEGALGGVVALIRRIVIFALVVEAAGAVLLTATFWRGRDPATALWFGVFHSVSAFTNASFDLMGGFSGFSGQQSDAFLLLVLAALIITGGISFAVVADLRRVRGFGRLTLDSKLVLVTTGLLLVAGTAGFFALERRDAGTLGPLPLPDALLQSFFYSVNSRSSGFQTLNAADFGSATLLLLAALMFVGGAAGSTAGGVKVNSVAVLAATVLSAVKGRPHVVVFWRTIPMRTVMRALTVAVLASLFVFAAAFTLTATESITFLPLLFEATSAFGTVGFSTGITHELDVLSRLVLILAMFVGRLGPLTLAVALAGPDDEARVRYPDADVRIG